MMPVPFLKLLKERMTSWLSDSTAAFQVLEKPRASCVTRAEEVEGGKCIKIEDPPFSFLGWGSLKFTCWPPTLLTFLPTQPFQLPFLQQRLGLLNEGDHPAKGWGEDLLDEFLWEVGGEMKVTRPPTPRCHPKIGGAPKIESGGALTWVRAESSCWKPSTSLLSSTARSWG